MFRGSLLLLTVCLFYFNTSEGAKENTEYQDALNNLISRLGVHNNNTSDNLVFMPPTFSVDIVSLLRWAVENTQIQSHGKEQVTSHVKNVVDQQQETFYPRSFLSLVEYNNKKYFFAKNQKFTWIESLTFCRSFGMDLVSIETAEEDNFIIEQLTNIGLISSVVWTSGNKIGRSTFLWMNGEQLIYENWYVNEPGHPATEHCIVLSSKKWHDWPCHQDEKHNHFAFFICEGR